MHQFPNETFEFGMKMPLATRLNVYSKKNSISCVQEQKVKVLATVQLSSSTERSSDRQKVKTISRPVKILIEVAKGKQTRLRECKESFVRRKVKIMVACDHLKCVRKLSIIIYFSNMRCCRLFSNEIDSRVDECIGSVVFKLWDVARFKITSRPQNILKLFLCQHRTYNQARNLLATCCTDKKF